MTPTEETTLEEELALGLDKYVEQLQAISAQASKEYALEKVKYWLFMRRTFLIIHGIHKMNDVNAEAMKFFSRKCKI